MGHGREILLGSLDLENFSITLFCTGKLIHERAGIAEVAERSRERLVIVGGPVINNGCLPGGASLDQITTMEKNPGTMFVVIRHGIRRS